jgi:hypothetical protein
MAKLSSIARTQLHVRMSDPSSTEGNTIHFETLICAISKIRKREIVDVLHPQSSEGHRRSRYMPSHFVLFDFALYHPLDDTTSRYYYYQKLPESADRYRGSLASVAVEHSD